MRVLNGSVVLVVAFQLNACSREPQVSAAPATAVSAPAPAGTGTSDVPHGDHNPHHGGIVFMYGDVHFEVVLDSGGRHQVFFSDSVRADLPASVASQVSIAIARPGAPAEVLSAHIDDTGESWVAEGRAVEAGGSSARISFTTSDGPYWIDTPFAATAP